MVEPQRCGKQRLEPDGAILGVGKRQPLGVDILRIRRIAARGGYPSLSPDDLPDGSESRFET